jgi:putative membrane-bound dehydrogenase-like protein
LFRHRNLSTLLDVPIRARTLLIPAGAAIVLSWALRGEAAPAPVAPADWRIELIAEAPTVRHPSVVCAAPDGRVFVAEDPMDIRAPASATQGRILCFHPDGRHTVFATNLYAVFGMQYLDGKVYVLHNPKFSVFTDDHGIGKDRSDLIESTHPKPWALDWNDHVPANFKLAMDGYFYIAVGDKGVYGAVGRDGKRVDLHGGGILRMRPDGTDLEVYCTGVRNILDVALNAEDEIFTYDNTDEHNWMGRLTHMIEGGFYGYPYDFVPRRPYTLWMMADFGAGAATGSFAYTEDALPPEYHDNLFLADFGKRQILRVRIERHGGTYRVVSKDEIFRDPPEDFRPVGIALSSDGAAIYICDWAHRDTKENVEVGRLWKMSYTGATRAARKPSWYEPAAMGLKCDAASEELVDALSHGSKNVRLTAQRELARRMRGRADGGVAKQLTALATDTTEKPHARWHALWALDADDDSSVAPLGRADSSAARLAALDANASVRRQALRVLARHPSADSSMLMTQAFNNADPSVRLAVAIGLGRVGSPEDVPSLIRKLDESDFFTRYAVFTAINRVGMKHAAAWKLIVEGLTNPRTREGTEFALRNAYEAELVQALEPLARDTARPTDTREAALRSLIALQHKPAPWKGEWWAYHPALQPPPTNATPWAGTEPIVNIMRDLVSDPAVEVRALAVSGIRAAKDQPGFEKLLARYAMEPELSIRRAIIQCAGSIKDEAAFAFLAQTIRHGKEPELTREAIVSMTALGSGASAIAEVLARPATALEVKLAAVNALGELRATNFVPQLMDELREESARVACIRALGKIGGSNACAALRPLLAAESLDTRVEAIKALGALRDTNSAPQLVAAWRVAETRQAALDALARMSDLRALEAYLAGLESANPAVREVCRKALVPIRSEALPEIEKKLSELNSTAVAELREVYKDLPAAEKLFESAGRLPTPEEYEAYALRERGDSNRGRELFFDENGVACSKCHSAAGQGKTVGPDLTSAGAQFARAALIEHVLYPSKAVREGYAQTIVETNDGETVSGLVQSETAETVSLLDATGQLHTINKKTIARRSVSSFSLMPEGLHAGLSLAQFADLIAYLESLRGQPAE